MRSSVDHVRVSLSLSVCVFGVFQAKRSVTPVRYINQSITGAINTAP